MSKDNVNHPSHYNSGKIEVIEFIEDQRMGFNRGNAIKYIARAGRKDPSFEKEIEDLEKAIWYLRRDVELIKSLVENRKPVRPNDMAKPTYEAARFKQSTYPLERYHQSIKCEACGAPGVIVGPEDRTAPLRVEIKHAVGCTDAAKLTAVDAKAPVDISFQLKPEALLPRFDLCASHNEPRDPVLMRCPTCYEESISRQPKSKGGKRSYGATEA